MNEILISISNDNGIKITSDILTLSKKIIYIFNKYLDKNANDKNTEVKFRTGPIENTNKKVYIKLNDSINMGNDKGPETVKFEKEIINICRQYNIYLSYDDFAETFNSSQIINSIPNVKKGTPQDNKNEDSDFDIDKKANQFTPVTPNYTWDGIILAQDIKEQIENAISLISYRKQVFENWGLYAIEPHPSTSLNFYGDSGTGKSLCAEAVAQKLHKKILKVSYSDVESKYHGEGPKMVKAIFHAAKKADAVLFFDEADSLLSKRLTGVNDGSSQAINSMRSQLLISIENFDGIVIFATNLMQNYDKAFCTRLHSIEFKKPDETIREKIWKLHLGKDHNNENRIISIPQADGTEKEIQVTLNIPLADDVNDESIKGLAKKYEFVGREIRNSVIKACVTVACEKKEDTIETRKVTLADLQKACEIINVEKEKEQNLKEKRQINYVTLVKEEPPVNKTKRSKNSNLANEVSLDNNVKINILADSTKIDEKITEKRRFWKRNRKSKIEKRIK